MQPVSEQVLVFNAGQQMLMEGLYKLKDLKNHPGKISAKVILDPNHEIFKGHYPGQPVLPGACMLQMVKDAVEGTLNQTVILKQAPQMKFLLLIDPHKNDHLMIDLNVADEEGLIKISGNLIADGKLCFKFSGSFTTVA